MRIGIIAHEFLINIGANDFLKNLLRGLALRPENDIVFLTPRSNEKIEHITSSTVKEQLKRIPGAKQALRAAVRKIGPLTDRLIREGAGEYAFYAEACPWMEIVPCQADVSSLQKIIGEQQLDLIMPSIHILGHEIPHLTYWPDCQPKYFPEFFDADSQRVRDERIKGLLATGRPMIVNSRAAKADMLKFYDADPNQIYDLPFAPIIEFMSHVPRPELARPYGLIRPYFLICNQFWIHKSIETVIEAAAIARDLDMEADIVFTGRMEEPRRPGYIDGLRDMIRNLGVTDRIKLLGYVPKADQLELMKGAVAVVQPTLFEGGPGGGSVYDAVSLGIRAIVSDIPINHELPLKKGHLETFKTRDAVDLVKKMQAFLSTPYKSASPEDLYQLSRRSAERLSERLYEAIDSALAGSQPKASNAN